jgi:hypothetical protein
VDVLAALLRDQNRPILNPAEPGHRGDGGKAKHVDGTAPRVLRVRIVARSRPLALAGLDLIAGFVPGYGLVI